jgi:hypothetical protein
MKRFQNFFMTIKNNEVDLNYFYFQINKNLKNIFIIQFKLSFPKYPFYIVPLVKYFTP